MKIHYFILVLLFCWSTYQVQGQENKSASHNLKFKHISSRDGLSQRSVAEILQDKKGYLWFGTRDGLNKYDGNTFTVYKHNSEDPKSISDSRIFAIYEDKKGDLWVGTMDGLNKYNPETDDFTRYKLSSRNDTNVGNKMVYDLIQFSGDTLWIGTNSGIDKLSLRDGNVVHFNNQLGENSNYLNVKMEGFYSSKNGNLWINAVDGITVFNPKNNTLTHYNYPEEATTKSQIFAVIFEDSHNNIWLGYDEGLAIFDTSKNKFVTYNFNNTKAISSAVRSICEDYSGNLWIGTYTGLYILNKENSTLNHILHKEDDPNSLSQNSIHKIVMDSRGDIWIGTWAGGINFYDKSLNVFKQFSVGNNKSLLNYGVVSAIVEDSLENLWIGTEGGGLNVYNKKTKEFIYYTHNPNDSNSLSSNNVDAILKDRIGNLWIGTYEHGLNFVNPNKSPLQFERFESSFVNGIPISNITIYDLLEDKNQNLWIGTPNGLLFYNKKTKVFAKLDNTSKSIMCIVQSNDPNYILYGGAHGLEKVNIYTKRKHKISFEKKQNTAFSSTSVNCIFIDHDSNYWIGTEGNGLYFYDPDTEKSLRYGSAQGLPSEVVYGILPDDNDNLWISSNHGISRLNLNTKQIKNFDELDGLQNNEFNYGAFVKTSRNELMFGGVNGISYFDPIKINENTFVPKIDIYELTVNNQPYVRITDDISNITLTHNQNNFNFDFTALSYSRSKKNQHAYKLEGFDDNWNYVGNNKTATYTNIEEGNYVFKVKASNNDGLWNKKGDSIALSVLPAPWKTWWAYLIYTIITIGVFYYLWLLELNKLNAKNELKQEKIDKQRIEEVNKLKLQLFTNISHEFRTPLILIVGPLQRMIAKKKGDKEIQEQHKGVYRNAVTLLQLINQLLDFRKSEAGKLKLKASKNNIIPFLEDVKLSFEDVAKERNINYTFKTTEDNIEVWFDQIELKKVIVNIISNAFKFTPDSGNISFKISTESILFDENNFDCIRLHIEDNGKGILKDDIEFIFDRFFQFGASNKKRSGSGVGLSLAKDIVELHHGTINVESAEGKGASFIVLLPLGDSHLDASERVYDDGPVDSDRFEYYDTALLKPKWVNHDSESQKTVINKDLPSVLLVEDNVEVRAFIKNIFEENFNIFEANNGIKGIEIAQSSPVDLIISDVVMPEMDGVEMCDTLKSDIKTSHIPIILLTAKTSTEDQKEGYKTGADIYITKPFDANILELQVNNIFSLRKNMILKFKQDIILTPKALSTTSADEQFLSKAFNIVEARISDSDFNAQLFTEEMGVSRTLLYTKLKVLTGQSLSEFIRTIRLKKAAQMIAQTEMNVSEIAYEVGFNDLKYFRQSFKHLFNSLPTAYRTNSQNSERT